MNNCRGVIILGVPVKYMIFRLAASEKNQMDHGGISECGTLSQLSNLAEVEYKKFTRV